ncbi:unnamed protein product [Blepharisma stoltei]|uniref:Uncharacterized protein n=1 Tax=Blepharisma stoltei TaxID=1481888 RepID=A0AAU9J966_9CILI|nr:unnamed protein product [Blepharisma stoltei]
MDYFNQAHIQQSSEESHELWPPLSAKDRVNEVKILKAGITIKNIFFRRLSRREAFAKWKETRTSYWFQKFKSMLDEISKERDSLMQENRDLFLALKNEDSSSSEENNTHKSERISLELPNIETNTVQELFSELEQFMGILKQKKFVLDREWVRLKEEKAKRSSRRRTEKDDLQHIHQINESIEAHERKLTENLMNYSMKLERQRSHEDDVERGHFPTKSAQFQSPSKLSENLDKFKSSLFRGSDPTDFWASAPKTDINEKLKTLEQELIKEQQKQKANRDRLQQEYQLLAREKKEIKVKEEELKEYQSFLEREGKHIQKSWLELSQLADSLETKQGAKLKCLADKRCQSWDCFSSKLSESSFIQLEEGGINNKGWDENISPKENEIFVTDQVIPKDYFFTESVSKIDPIHDIKIEPDESFSPYKPLHFEITQSKNSTITGFLKQIKNDLLIQWIKYSQKSNYRIAFYLWKYNCLKDKNESPREVLLDILWLKRRKELKAQGLLTIENYSKKRREFETSAFAKKQKKLFQTHTLRVLKATTRHWRQRILFLIKKYLYKWFSNSLSNKSSELCVTLKNIPPSNPPQNQVLSVTTLRADLSNSSVFDLSAITLHEKNVGIIKFICFLSKIQGKQERNINIRFNKWNASTKKKSFENMKSVLKEFENRISTLKIQDTAFRTEIIIQQKKLESKLSQMKTVLKNLAACSSTNNSNAKIQ